MPAHAPSTPLYIKIHENDNVAIVANDGGLPAGSRFACGLTLLEHVPQGHKVALADLKPGDPVMRYNVVIGYAARELSRGAWVNERVTTMPVAPSLDNLPIATRAAPVTTPL
jgi:galactarate dehydratase